jgi:hypothetical protein
MTLYKLISLHSADEDENDRIFSKSEFCKDMGRSVLAYVKYYPKIYLGNTE